MHSVPMFSEDDLLQIVRTGPFENALRAAIHARGIGLDALNRRLRARGVPVSVACLSHGQCGRTAPERAASLRAVRELETILELPPYSLLMLLRPRGRQATSPLPLDRLCQEPSVKALVDGICPGTERQLTALSLQSRHQLGPYRQLLNIRTRMVFRARQSGADRWIAVYSHQHGLLPVERAAEGCRFGRIRTDPVAGVIATELLFDRPLRHGETYLLDYTFTFDESGPPMTGDARALRIPVQQFLLETQFHPNATPMRCYRVWRPDGRTPLQDVSILRLSLHDTIHFVGVGLTKGHHGTRWEWD